MKKIFAFIILILFSIGIFGQSRTYTNFHIEKLLPGLYLDGLNGYIDFYNNDLRLTHSSNQLTLSGGNLSLGANNLLGTGSIGATGSRILKGWFTSLEITNLPTVAGVPVLLTSDSTIYTSDHRGDVIEADLADFETIPDWVVTFVIGGGNPNDSLAFADSTIRSFPNHTGKVMHVTKVNAVLGHGEGLDSLGIQIQWHAVFKSASSTKLWTLPLPIGRPNCYTIGTTSTTFANDLIPVDARIVLTLPYIPADNEKRKPVYAEITMSGHYN